MVHSRAEFVYTYRQAPARRRWGSRLLLQVQHKSMTFLLWSAALAFLSIDTSRGLVLHNRSPSVQGHRQHLAGASRPPQKLRARGRWRCNGGQEILLPRCCGTAVGHKDETTDAGGVVHTLLIDNYDSYTYNLFQQLAVINGRAPYVVYNDDDGGDLWKTIERMGCTPDNIVISPGPGRPDVPADFGMCAQALREATNIPILGVCLGHEGLGLAHRATVTRARKPMHGRFSPVFHDGDPLFRGVPQGARVVRYHSLVVDTASMPADGPLRATAWTGDGVLMAMRHVDYPHWGVQFHPESVGTRHGSDIVRNFRELTLGWRRTRGGGSRPDEAVGRGSWAAPARFSQNSAVAAGNGAAGGGLPVAESIPAMEEESAHNSLVEGVVSVPPPSSTAHRRRFVLHAQEVSMSKGCVGDRTAKAPMPDTEHAFRALYGNEPTAWWLDSSSQRPGLAVDGQAKARFTFMGGADGPLCEIIECYGDDRLVIQDRLLAGKSGEGGGDGTGRSREVCANILDYLKSEMGKMGHASGLDSDGEKGLEVRMVGAAGESRGETGPSAGGRHGSEASRARATLPFDFLGGYVGFLGYELRHEASEVLGRSVGGTKWDWKPPNGGCWQDAAFEENVTSGVDASASATEPGLGEIVAGGSAEGNGDVPLGFLVFADRFVVFDHQEGKAYVLALTGAPATGEELDTVENVQDVQPKAVPSSDPDAVALEWIRRTADTLHSISSKGSNYGAEAKGLEEAVSHTTEDAAPTSGVGSTTCAMDVPRSQYERSLNEIMRLVGEGETYEVCLTNQIVCERPGGGVTSPLDLYARLRRSNPAPYAAYIVHDPQRRLSPAAGRGSAARAAGPSFAVCCSSPEKFLKVDRHGWVESKPIKGTVKRGKTPAEDLALATDLATGEKNMAENLMIVDLVRNDLGRVCRTGSVSVPKLMHVESYATVHQLVSTIQGRLSSGCGALDAVAAAFPGGSMTGAPKQRTMEIIDRLEGGRSRGVYSGSIGFLGVDGAADLNIVIRTAVVTPHNVTVGAGGAVIALSEIDDEYEEMLLKATSVLGAIGHKQRPGEQGPLGSEPSREESASNGELLQEDEAPRDGTRGLGNVLRNGEQRSVVRPLGAVDVGGRSAARQTPAIPDDSAS